MQFAYYFDKNNENVLKNERILEILKNNFEHFIGGDTFLKIYILHEMVTVLYTFQMFYLMSFLSS